MIDLPPSLWAPGSSSWFKTNYKMWSCRRPCDAQYRMWREQNKWPKGVGEAFFLSPVFSLFSCPFSSHLSEPFTTSITFLSPSHQSGLIFCPIPEMQLQLYIVWSRATIKCADQCNSDRKPKHPHVKPLKSFKDFLKIKFLLSNHHENSLKKSSLIL